MVVTCIARTSVEATYGPFRGTLDTRRWLFMNGGNTGVGLRRMEEDLGEINAVEGLTTANVWLSRGYKRILFLATTVSAASLAQTLRNDFRRGVTNYIRE